MNEMSCECTKLIDNLITRNRRDAKQVGFQFRNSLDAFKSGIVEGAKELIARHLYRSGVYQASLDSSLSRHFDPLKILSSLEKRVSKSEPDIYSFFLQNKQRVEEQSQGVDIDKLLRGVLKNKESSKGLLEGNVLRELAQVKLLIERMERLDKYLASWRESIRMEGTVEMKVIVDIHSP